LSQHSLDSDIQNTRSQILISEQALDLAYWTQQAHLNQGESGAIVTFTGAVRNSDGEQGLTGMTLEHYPGMTESQLSDILTQANQHWSLNKSILVHRVGYLTPGEPIVFVATCSQHRKAAFAAGQFIMDYLKKKATFWKKEHYSNRVIWVEAKQSDHQAADAWQLEQNAHKSFDKS
jgi:molybdopterin synthase catalytic subunit